MRYCELQGGSVPEMMLSEETHYQILKALEANPELSQRALSRILGVSLGKVNYCLRALVDKGLVKAENFRNQGKKSVYGYLLTPKGLKSKAEITLAFLRRKQLEVEHLQQEIEGLRREVLLQQGKSL